MDSTVPPVVLRSVPSEEHRRRGPDSGRVLVLNATYEPINVCSVRRAVVLLLKEKAELLERGRWELHSESSTVARPVVIRLVSYVRVPRDAHRRKITRRAVFARDGWTCQYCGSRSNLTVDHVIPRSKGGNSSWENIVASCAPCNRRKGDRLPAPGRDAPRACAAHAASGDLHPRRLADDPDGVAAVPAPPGSGPAAGLHQTVANEGALDRTPLADTAVTGKTETAHAAAGGTRTGDRLGVSRVGFRQAVQPSDLAAGHLQGPARTVTKRVDHLLSLVWAE